MQHDAHEFLSYLLGNLQEETTPIDGSVFDGSREGLTPEQAWQEYKSAHPSIVDQLFTGKFLI